MMRKSRATPKLLIFVFSLVLLLILPTIYITHAINNTENHTDLSDNVTYDQNQAFNSSHNPRVDAVNKPTNTTENLTPYLPSKIYEPVLSPYPIISGQILNIRALLAYENKTPIPYQELMFYRNKTLIESGSTNETGWARINWIPNISGTCIINTTYSGNHALNIFPAFNFTKFIVLAANQTNQTNATKATTNIASQAIPEITPVLTAAKKHFNLDENPKFKFSYITEEEFNLGITKKALTVLATEKESIETAVYYGNELTQIKPDIEKLRDGKFYIELPKKRSLQAGIYTLKVQLTKDNIIYVEVQEFPWGLVSLNTKKSIYKPGETSEFIIVVLDSIGHPLCSADISLAVTDPHNKKTTYSTSEGTITQDAECGIYNARYPTETEGNHTIDITALIDGIDIHFSTTFKVMQNYDFDIIRVTQSKIDPTRQNWFDTRINIESFTGTDTITIKEFVPREFTISTDANVLEDGDTKILTWNKNFYNDRTSIYYSYSVPAIWPYLYALGPAEIIYGSKTFKEARSWYTAVDPGEPHLILFWDNDTVDAPAGWTCISCEPGDLFYERFPRGAPQYGATGGSSTHTHAVSLVSSFPPSGTISDKLGNDVYPASSNHVHNTLNSSSTSNVSLLPPYRNMKIIVYDDGIPGTIPKGAIAVFNTTSLPQAWDAYSLQDGYFARGSGQISAGENNTLHAHTINITTGGPSHTSGWSIGKKDYAASANHIHSVSGAGPTSQADHRPRYIEAVFAKAKSNTTIPRASQGMIAMFNATPPEGWVVMSASGGDFAGRFIVGNSTGYGITGGTESHTHDELTVIAGGPSATVGGKYGDPNSVAVGSDNHVHEIAVSFDNVSNLPPYRDIVFAYAGPGIDKEHPFVINITDSKGDSISLYTEINETGNSTYDVEMVFDNISISRIKFEGLIINESENETFKLGLEDIPESKVSIGGVKPINAYAVNPENLTFENAMFTVISCGRELWKCRDWDFAEQKCFGTWQKIMDLVPGKEYNVTFTAEDPGYAETGVASINTKKSIYHTGDIAEIIMVVLDTGGYLISNADVVLNITSPDDTVYSYSTSGNDITETERGIYEADFTGTGLEGNYTLFVEATGNNVNNSMISYFTVKDYYEFDILRTTPVTMDPWKGAFDSSIKLVSFTAASIFNFSEAIPVNFTITDNGSADSIVIKNNRKVLSWQNLVNNSVISYIYYDSKTFPEARIWYLAVDPIPSALFYESFETSVPPTGWTQDIQNDWDQDSTIAIDGTYSAHADATGDGWLEYTAGIDMRGKNSVNITFSWWIASSLVEGEYLCFDINNGTYINDVACLNATVDPKDTWVNESINLVPAYGTVSNLTFRFRAKAGNVADEVYVDAVNVSDYGNYVSWNVSTLNLGTGYNTSSGLTGYAKITSDNTNTDVTVTCVSGNCTIITENWDDTTDMIDTESENQNITCSNSILGSFWAIFNLTSVEDPYPDSINVSCIIKEDTYPPQISIESPKNQTYADLTIWFNTTLDEHTSWCGYSLDGAPNITMQNDTVTHFYAQNTTMAEGTHHVTFTCNDTLGNINTTDERHFTINRIIYAHGPNWNDYLNPDGSHTKYIGKLKNYYNGTEYLPVNTSIVPIDDDVYDYGVLNGTYKAYFETLASTGSTVKFSINQSVINKPNPKDSYVTYQPISLNYRSANDGLQPLDSTQSVAASISGNTLIYPEIFGSNYNLTFEYTPDRLKSRLILNTAPPTPDQYMLDNGNVTLDLDFVLDYDAKLDIYVDGVFWDKGVDIETKNRVDFKDSTTGDLLFYLPKPYAYDSDYNTEELSYKLKTNGYIQIISNYTWLNSTERVYPVIIDPSTDIGYNYTSNTYHLWNNVDNYYVNLTTGIQVTNHESEYWGYSKYCTSLYNNQWYQYCTDDSEWEWTATTDNETYINLTGAATFNDQGNSINFTLEYYLEMNWSEIHITPFIENIGNRNYTDSKINVLNYDIRINTTVENDTFEVPLTQGWTSYNLSNNSLALVLNQDNLTERRFELRDQSYPQLAKTRWNESYFLNGQNHTMNYTINVTHTPDWYNAPVDLIFNTGEFNESDVLNTNLWWIDAFSCSVSISPTDAQQLSATNNEHYNMVCTPDCGGGQPQDITLTQQYCDNSGCTGTVTTISADNAEDIISINSSLSTDINPETGTSSSVVQSTEVQGYNEGEVWVRCQVDWGSVAYSSIINVDVTEDQNLPVTSETTVNTTSVSPGSTICINHTVTKGTYDTDKTWVEITFPNATKANITTSNTTGVCGAGGSIYGVEINVGSTAGTFTVNTSWVNDSQSNYDYDDPYPNLDVLVDSTPPIITIQSPQNQSYSQSIWFNVTLNEAGDWCAYSLDGAPNVTMSNSSGNWNKQNTTMSDGSHYVTFSCNDTLGNMNSSAITEYFTVETTHPQYSLNQTNTTAAGAVTLFTLYWTDNALAGYIFSFDNGNGTFYNDSYLEMTGTGNWSNVTKTINTTADTTIRWIIYANDTAGNMNTSLTYSFQTMAGPPATVTVKTYRNSSYSGTDKFFDRLETVYVESNVTDSGGNPITAATVKANFTIAGSLEKSITLLHYSGASYRGNWTTNSTNTAGIYSVIIAANNSAGSATGDNTFHLYSGENVSAYEMDYNDDGINESIMENKHLIVAFNRPSVVNGSVSTVSSYIEQKDTNISYQFGTISDSDGNTCGGLTGTNSSSVEFKELSLTLGENLASGEFNLSVVARGDMDLVSGESSFKDWWHENNGTYTTSWSTYRVDYVVTGYPSNVYDMAVGDLNGDMVLDVVVVIPYSGSDPTVFIQTNNGTGNFTRTSTISEDVIVRAVAIGDINGDGLGDIVTGDQNNRVRLHMNNNDNTWDSTTVYTTGDEVWSIAIGDVDGDGDNDIVSASDNIYFYENNGTYTGTWTTHTVDSDSTSYYSVTMGDIDGDGDNDIVSGDNANKIFFYENTGTYTSEWTTYTVYTVGGNPKQFRSVNIGDIDGDGDNDIVSADNSASSPYTGDVFFHENDGTYTSEWTTNTVYTPDDWVRLAVIGDIDGDGDIDIASGTDDGNKVYFHENNGTYTGTWTTNTVSTPGSFPMALDIADLDDAVKSDITIELRNENADYLTYKLTNLNYTGTDYFNHIFSDITGTLGTSASDDRYHLQDGTDGLVTDLTSGQWNNYAQTNSNYSLIYDNSTGSDSVNDNVIAWMRFNETENITYHDAGLWNDTTYSTAGSRIRYDTSQATMSDEAYYILAFTKGNWKTIDAWMPTIEDGNFPPVNFMTAFIFVPSSVTTKTYSNSSYTESDKFFDRLQTIYVESNVTDSYGDPLTNATVKANFTIGDSLEKSITLLHYSGASYRGNWTTNSTSTVGVYNVTVIANKSGGSKTASNTFHLYPGGNVSAYRMDYTGDGINESIMENKHLIIVFNETDNTDKLLLYLEQKDTNISYTYGSISDTNSIGQGEVTTTNLKGIRIFNFSFTSEGENLLNVDLDMKINVTDPPPLAWEKPENIGIEELGDQWHLWNEKEHYYIQKYDGVQITNHDQVFWTDNTLCFEYFDTIWKETCAGKSGWNWTVDSNEGFVKLTGTTHLTSIELDAELTLDYYIESGWEEIKITHAIKNSAKNYTDSRLLLKMHDIRIADTLEGDTFNAPVLTKTHVLENSYFIDEQWISWDLNDQNLSLLITQENQSQRIMEVRDNPDKEMIRITLEESLWKDNKRSELNYSINVTHTNEYNAPFLLSLSLGRLDVGVSANASFMWIDKSYNDTWANVSFNSTDDYAALGYGIASGDFNNDSIDDALVSATGNNAHGITSAGRAFIFYGPLQGSFNDAQANVSFNCTDDVSFFGFAVDSGDFNNDSVDDALISAYNNNAHGITSAGRAFIFYGGSSLQGSFNDTQANVSFNGTDPVGYFGYHVATGDFNNDSVHDAMISAPDNDAPGIKGGMVFIFYGPLQGSFNDTQANVSFNGTDADGKLGRSISMGDFNGDNVDDALVGAYTNDATGLSSGGRAFIFYGSSSLQGSFNDTQANVSFNGTASYGYLGHGLGRIDINGDSVDDVIVSSYYTEITGVNGGGIVFVFHGGSSLQGSFNDTQANVSFNGTSTIGRFGYIVKSGDFNNDGRGDILIGAYSNNATGLSEGGRVFIFHGDSSLQGSFNDTQADVSFNGTDVGARFGRSLAIGDFNNDNVDDVMIGAYNNNASGIKGGMAFIFYGWDEPTASFNLTIRMGSENVDYLVYKLHNFDSSIDDINDIFSDIAGTLGTSASDDRYHLQDGTDGLVTDLTSGQWNNYAQTSSNYSLIYDNSTGSDSVNDNVIAWIRFNETENITYQNAGLWNDTTYSTAGSRIRYNTTNTTSTDEVYYILAFTQGDYNTIHKWMPTIEGGNFPTTNFMTAPGGADEDPPTITIQSPLNDTYPTTSIWFNVTLDEPGDWCGYSLDAAQNITMTNTSGNWNNLTTVAEGTHNVTFSCNDTAGNMNSSAITEYFTVAISPGYFNITATPPVGITANQSNYSVDWTDGTELDTCIFSHTFEPTVLDTQNQTTSNRLTGFGSTRYRAQSFIPDSSGYIINASAYLDYQTGTKGNVIYEIRPNDLDRPGTTVLGQATIPAALITTADWYNANFTAPVSVSTGVTYWLIITSPTSSTNNVYRVHYSSSDTYSEGYMAYSFDSGATWTTQASYDIRFKVETAEFNYRNETKSLSGTSDTCTFSITPQYNLTGSWYQCANDTINNLNCTLEQTYHVITAEDTEYPKGELLSPLNNSKVNGNVTLLATVSDNVGLDYAYFQWKNTTDPWTNLTDCLTDCLSLPACNPNCTWITAEFENSTEGYEIRVVPVDLSGNKNTSTALFNYFIDRYSPFLENITTTYPSAQTYITNGQTVSLSLSARDSPEQESGMNTTWVDLSNLNTSGNITMAFVSGSKEAGYWSDWELNITLSGATTGTQTAVITVYDNATPANNIRTGEIFIVNVDADSPQHFDISRDTDPNYIDANVTCQARWTDNIGLKSYIFSSNFTTVWTNDTIQNLTGTQNWSVVTKNMTNSGNFGWRIYAFDHVNNSNDTGIQYITILPTYIPPPVVNLIGPPSDTTTTNTTINLTYNITDLTDGQLDTCELYLEWTLNTTDNTVVVNDTMNFTIDGIAEGYHEWYILCNNTDNAKSISDTWNFTVDSILPTITIQSPLNDTYNTQSVWFNVTLNKAGDWCGYSLDGAPNITMTNSSGNWNNLTTVSEGTHNVTFSCNDTEGNMNSSAITEYFTVDVTYPQYSLNQTNSTEAGADTLFSLYWQDNIQLAGYIFSFDNGTGTFTNDTYTEMTGTTNWSNVTKTVNTTADTTIRWIVYANDTAGNLNTSDTYAFQTTSGDETPPTITIQSPENQSYNTQSIWFNATLNEAGSWCGYSLDAAPNVTMDNTTGNWNKQNTSMSEATHNVTFSCNDTAGNMNSSAITEYFTVDVTYPTYSQNQTNTTEVGAATLFSLYWEDNYALAGYIFSFDNGTGAFNNDTYTEMTGTTNWSNATKTINSTADTTIRWTVYANDTAGNMNTSGTYTFQTTTTDETPPEITNINTNPQLQGFGENITINATVTDAGDVDTVLLEITDPESQKTNYTMTNITATYFEYNYTDYTNGTYSYKIYANDTLGNQDNSSASAFQMYVNMSIQVRTLKDSYTDNELVNLTDPPGFEQLSSFINTYLKETPTTETPPSSAPSATVREPQTTPAIETQSKPIETKTREITLHLTPSEITEMEVQSPTNTTYATYAIWFNITLDDTGDWCAYSLDNTSNITMQNDTQTHYYTQNTSMQEGHHTVIFTCNDTLGNLNTTEEMHFTIGSIINDRGPNWNEYLNPDGSHTKYIGKLKNYYNGAEYIPMNATIARDPSSEPLYAYGAENGTYKAYFKEDPSVSGTLVKFWINQSAIDKPNPKIGYITYQPNSLNYRSGTSGLQQLSIPQSITGAPDKSTMIYPGIFGANYNLTYEYTADRLIKRLILNTTPPAPQQYILDGGNVTLDMDYVIDYAVDLDIYINGTLWDESETETTERVDFKDTATGETVFYLPKPYAYDADYYSNESTYRLKKTGNTIYLIIRTPYEWLNDTERAYPVTIDPSTDIGYEYENNTYHLWNNVDNYYVNLTSGIQTTNHESEYWGYNRYCTRLYESQWYQYCTDDSTWEWSATTDNETYTNLTGAASFNEDGNSLNFSLEYYLETSWTEIRITPVITNIGTRNYTDTELTLENYDIRINTHVENDTIELPVIPGWVSYDLASRKFYLWDRNDNQFARTRWNESYFLNSDNHTMNYTINTTHTGVWYNAPVILTLETGAFNASDILTTNLWWIDAEPTPPSDCDRCMWVVCGDDYIYRVDMDAVSVSLESWDTATSYPMGVDYYDGWIYFVNTDDNGIMYRNYPNGTVNQSWDLSAFSQDPYGLTNNGTHFFIADKINDEMYVTTISDPSALVASWSILPDTEGCSWKESEDMIYIVSSGQDKAAKYYPNGTFVISWDLNTNIGSATGIAWDGTYWWITDDADNRVYTLTQSELESSGFTDTFQTPAADDQGLAILVIHYIKWNQTILDLGSGVIENGNLTSTVRISSTETNNDVNVTCSGNCTAITTNWTIRNMADGQSDEVLIICSDASSGIFQATFNVGSDGDSIEDISLTVDCQIVDNPPTVTNVTATPQKVLNGTTVEINVTVADAHTDVDTVIAKFYYPNGTHWKNVSMNNITSSYNASTTVTFTPRGTYTVTIWANDTEGNINDSETIWFAPYIPLSDFQNIIINGSFEEWGCVENVTDIAEDADASMYTIESNIVNTSTVQHATRSGFQRKTWHDGTRYWTALHNGSYLLFWYSANGSGWTENTNAQIAVNTSGDFSIEADSSYAFIVYWDGEYDILVRNASTTTSYPGVGFSWADATTVFDGNSASDKYYYPAISRDTNNKIRIDATTLQSSNYYIQSRLSTNANNITAWGSADNVSDTSNTDANVYGTIAPLAGGKMYAAWIDGTDIMGKKHNGAGWDVLPTSIAAGLSGLEHNMQMISDTSNNEAYLLYIDDSGKSIFRKSLYVPLAWGDSGIIAVSNNDSGEVPYAMTRDSAGNIYAAGTYYNVANGDADWMIRKYDANGDLATGWGDFDSGIINVTVDYGSDVLFAITIDSAGSIYVAGYSNNSATDHYNWRIRKYDANGDLATGWGDSGVITVDNNDGNSYLFAITSDSAGSIYAAGSSWNAANNDNDWMIRKYDANGDLATGWGDIDSGIINLDQYDYADYCYAITIDSAGSIYVAGAYTNLDTVTDWMIRKYDANGDLATGWGDSGIIIDAESGSHYIYAITIDSENNIYVAGSYRQPTYYNDWMIHKYDANGDLATDWGDLDSGIIRVLNKDYTDTPYAITVDSAGSIYVAGHYYISSSDDDWMIRKYDANGDQATDWGHHH